MNGKAEEFALRYQDQAVKLAHLISDLGDVYDRLKYTSEQAEDNGDPYFKLLDAFLPLATALASCVTYADEYKAEADKERSKKAK